MDIIQGLGEIALGSRLKRISDHLMKETQIVYNHFSIDFDPYLFPVYKLISNNNGITNTYIYNTIGLSQPAITQAINKLSKKELIIIENDTLDRRKKIIKLSDKGNTLLKQLRPIWNAIDLAIKEFTMETSSSLITHLNNFEQKLRNASFSLTIIDSVGIKNSAIQINTYQNKPEENTAFYSLNEQWLSSYFYLEPYDHDVLSNPGTYIINKGGFIFFARLNGDIVGTVAIMPVPDQNTFELTKMAVSPKHRGQKIGQQLMQYCLEFAKNQEFSNLILYSNRILENAIYIYRKYGFVEIPLEINTPYKRSDIKMEVIF